MKTKSKIVVALSSVALLCFAFVAYFSFANNTSENLNNTTIPEAQTNNVSNNIREEFLPTTSQKVYSNNNTYSSNILSEEDEAAYLSSCMDVVVKEGNQKAAEKREAAKNSDNTLCSTAKDNDVDLYYLIKYDPEANQNTLHISSEAVHNDDTYTGFDSENEVPWYDNRFDISKVEIDDIIHPLCLKAWFGCINKLDSGQVKLSNIVSFSGLENIQLDDNFNGNASFLFAGCNRIPADTTFSSTNLAKVTNAMAMFTWSAFSDENLQTFLSNLTASTDFSYSFCHTGITKAVLPQSAIQNATSLEGMFSNDNLLSQVLNLPSTTIATKAVKMFNNCSSLWDIQAADGTDWSNLTSLESANMFNGCIQLPNYTKYSERGELDKTHVNFTKIDKDDTGGFIVKQGAPKISIEIDNVEHGEIWVADGWTKNPLTINENESGFRFNYFDSGQGKGQINIYGDQWAYKGCSGVNYTGSYINKAYQIKTDSTEWRTLTYGDDFYVTENTYIKIITPSDYSLTVTADEGSGITITPYDIDNPYNFVDGYYFRWALDGSGQYNQIEVWSTSTPQEGGWVGCIQLTNFDTSKYDLGLTVQIGSAEPRELVYDEMIQMSGQNYIVNAYLKEKPAPSTGIVWYAAGLPDSSTAVTRFTWNDGEEQTGDNTITCSGGNMWQHGQSNPPTVNFTQAAKATIKKTVSAGDILTLTITSGKAITVNGTKVDVVDGKATYTFTEETSNPVIGFEGTVKVNQIELGSGEPPVQTHTLTINYVDEDGKGLIDSYIGEYKEGDTYSVKSPVIEGYTLVDPGQSTISGTMGDTDITVEVKYKEYTPTGIVWYAAGLPDSSTAVTRFTWNDGEEQTGDNTITCSGGNMWQHGQSNPPTVNFTPAATATIKKTVSASDILTLTITSGKAITVNGTKVDVVDGKATYTFTEETSNPVIGFEGGTVKVNQIELGSGEPPVQTHTLTINYVDEDGKKVEDTYFDEYKEGDDYSVDSPEVPGYTLVDPEQATISGTMGDKDITVDVKYKLESAAHTLKFIEDPNGTMLKDPEETPNPFPFQVSDNLVFAYYREDNEGAIAIYKNVGPDEFEYVCAFGMMYDPNVKFQGLYAKLGDNPEIPLEDYSESGTIYNMDDIDITIIPHSEIKPVESFTMSAQIDDESRGKIQVTDYLENPLQFSTGDTISFKKDKDSEEGYPQIFVAIESASGIQYDLGYYQLVLNQEYQLDKFTYNIGGDEIDIQDGQWYTISNNNIIITAHTFGEPPTPTFTMSAQIDDETKGYINPYHLDNPCSFDANDAVAFKASVSEQGSYPQIEVNTTKQSGVIASGSYRLICNPGYQLEKFTYKFDEQGQEFDIGDEWINIREANIMFTAHTKEKAVTRTALFDSYNGVTYKYYPVFNANDASKYRFYKSKTSSEALPVNSMSDLKTPIEEGNLYVECLTETPCTAIRGAAESYDEAFRNGQYIGNHDYFKSKGETCANINWKPESTSSTDEPKINDVLISGDNGIYSAYGSSPFAGYNGVWSCVDNWWDAAISWDIKDGKRGWSNWFSYLAVVFTRDFR